MEIYTLFGIIFLSSILLGNAVYSDNTSIYAQKIQTGTENEAEVNTDIEQENKCKKDTECENENEINNVLDIKNITKIVTVQQDTDNTATLNVIKIVNCQVEGDALGTLDNECDGIGPEDFDITVTGNNPNPSNFPGSSSGTSVTLEAGQYTVSETNNIPPGDNPITVVASFGDDCTQNGDFEADGTISAGQEQTCTITNDVTIEDTTATLNVIKNVNCQVEGDALGTLDNECDGIGPEDFDITVTGNNPNPSNFPGSDSGTSVTLEAGQYTVSETNNIPPGDNPITVVASFGDDCTQNGDFEADGTISAGQEQTCTITNDVTIEDTTATLNVIKNVNCQVEEDALSTLDNECDGIGPEDFDITVTGNNPNPSNFPGSSSGTSVTLEAGQYTVSETNNIGGDIEINAQFSGDCTQDEEDFEADGTIAAGEEQTCTITNNVTLED